MTTAAPSTALATIQPAFTTPERLALAGFLARYRGLTREAYALDLRQFTTWCRARSVALFAVRRADIESFARELEAGGRARATVTRRLSVTWNHPACRHVCEGLHTVASPQVTGDGGLAGDGCDGAAGPSGRCWGGMSGRLSG